VLDAAADILLMHRNIRTIEVGGHTDNRGPRWANLRLSEARANAVRDYLIKKGVAPERLVAKGYGPDKPIVNNDTEEGRVRNRRVQFTILEREPTPPMRSYDRPGKPPRARSGPPLADGFGRVDALLRRGDREEARAMARAWHDESPDDMLSVVALGEALEAAGAPQEAARAYGSIIDLQPSVAPARRWAGALLEHVSASVPSALPLAIDSYRRALADRPDHPSSYQALAHGLLRAGQPEQAFEIVARLWPFAFDHRRFTGINDILRDDIGLAAAAWTRVAPDRAEEIAKRARAAGATVPSPPSLHVVLRWETDASDLDLHVIDKNGNDAFDATIALPTGGGAYNDATDGYGPEAFAVHGEPQGFPYRIEVRSYRRGPMGYDAGSVEIIRHDGKGNLTFDTRPFVIMNEGASVDLGVVER
jgi:tetratricopeptide (TPR) repeat protein